MFKKSFTNVHGSEKSWFMWYWSYAGAKIA